eukprot:403376881
MNQQQQQLSNFPQKSQNSQRQQQQFKLNAIVQQTDANNSLQSTINQPDQANNVFTQQNNTSVNLLNQNLTIDNRNSLRSSIEKTVLDAQLSSKQNSYEKNKQSPLRNKNSDRLISSYIYPQQQNIQQQNTELLNNSLNSRPQSVTFSYDNVQDGHQQRVQFKQNNVQRDSEASQNQQYVIQQNMNTLNDSLNKRSSSQFDSYNSQKQNSFQISPKDRQNIPRPYLNTNDRRQVDNQLSQNDRQANIFIEQNSMQTFENQNERLDSQVSDQFDQIPHLEATNEKMSPDQNYQVIGINEQYGSLPSSVEDNSGKIELIRNLTQDLELKLKELNKLKESLQNSASSTWTYDEQKSQNKRTFMTISSLEDFLGLSLDAIKVLQLDLAASQEQLFQEKKERQKMRDLTFKQDQEKEEIFKQYDVQLEECRRQLEEEAEIKLQLQTQIEEETKEIEFLKLQLSDRETFQQNKSEMMNGSKQYFESLVFQNNHIQLELKKLSEQFREYMNMQSLKSKVESGNTMSQQFQQSRKSQQMNEEKFYVDQQQLLQISNVLSQVDKQSVLGLIIKERFQNRVVQLVQEEEYGVLLMACFKVLHDLFIGSQQSNQNSEFASQESQVKNMILSQSNLDDQYQYYMNLVNDQSMQEPKSQKDSLKNHLKHHRPSTSKEIQYQNSLERQQKLQEIHAQQFHRKNKHCTDCYDFLQPSELVIDQKSQITTISNNTKNSRSNSKKKQVTYNQNVEEVEYVENRPFKPNVNAYNKPNVPYLEWNQTSKPKVNYRSGSKSPQKNQQAVKYIENQNNQSQKPSISQTKLAQSSTNHNSRGRTASKNQTIDSRNNANQSFKNQKAMFADQNIPQYKQQLEGSNKKMHRRTPSQADLKRNASPNKIYRLDMENSMFKEYNPVSASFQSRGHNNSALNSNNNSQSRSKNYLVNNSSQSQRENQNLSIKNQSRYDQSPLTYSELEAFPKNSQRTYDKRSQEQSNGAVANTQQSNKQGRNMKDKYLQSRQGKSQV